MFVEVGARIYLWGTSRPPRQRIHNFFYFDRDGIFRIKPHATGWHSGYDGFPVKIQVNSLGFRGPEIRRDPKHRIVFIGDSVVFDGGVKQEKTFIYLLERAFQEKGMDVEVINGGTTNVGVDQYLKQVKSSRIRSLNSNLIIIGLYLNDSRPPQGFLGESKDLKGLLRILSLPALRTFAAVQLTKEFYVTRLLARGENPVNRRFDWGKRFIARRWVRDFSEFRQTVWEARFDWGAAWYSSFGELAFPTLREIRDIVQKEGGILGLVIYPVSLQVETEVEDPYITVPQAKVLKFATEEGIPTFDLLPRLRAHKQERLYPDPAHLNERGNQVVAENLYPFLKDLLGRHSKKAYK